MNVGSLFSGIGGFDLGFERAGMRTVWFVEQDAYCQAVLRRHWPGLPIYDDVRTVGADTLPPVDVLCGGFPCQDISVAGRGAGLDGERSGLWSEFARLVGELRPRYVVVENVPPLRRRGLDQVLEDLDACGYDAEWDGISASAVGAPHQRDRIWLVAYPRGKQLWQQSGRLSGTSGSSAPFTGVDGPIQRLANTERQGPQGQRPKARQTEVTESRDGGASLADTTRRVRGAWSDAELPESQGRRRPADSGWWEVEPDVGRVAHGVPSRVDRLRALGNSLVPQIAEWIGRRIMSYEASNVA